MTESSMGRPPEPSISLAPRIVIGGGDSSVGSVSPQAVRRRAESVASRVMILIRSNRSKLRYFTFPALTRLAKMR